MYLIRASYHYYANTIHDGRVLYYGTAVDEHGMDPYAPLVGFPDRESTKAAISAIYDKRYYLSNGEYAAPTLTAVPVSCAPAHVRDRVRGGCHD